MLNTKKPTIGKLGLIASRFFAMLGVTLAMIIVFLYLGMFLIVNGPSPTAGKLFVLSLKETSAGGFIADWYMSEAEINELKAEKPEEKEEEIDVSLIRLPDNGKDVSPEKEPSPDSNNMGDVKTELEGIEVYDVAGPTYNGKMLIVSDPKRIIVGVPKSYGEGSHGLSLSAMIEKYSAVGGTNAGGFVDPDGKGTGGIPEGIVISEGNLLWGSTSLSYSLAGLDEKGILYVGKMTGKAALDLGLQYAVSYGPALIINGEPCNSNRSLGGGINPRTAIGQREDGAILLLVVNGRQLDSLGATLDDLVEIMLSFGAVNASNLDGGSSSLMKLGDKYLNTSSYILGSERVLASTILIKEN